MKLIPVTVKSMDDIKSFVSDMNTLDFNVQLTNGKYEVSAKSLMAILTFHTENQTYVYAVDDTNYDILLNKVQPYRKD